MAFCNKVIAVQPVANTDFATITVSTDMIWQKHRWFNTCALSLQYLHNYYYLLFLKQ